MTETITLPNGRSFNVVGGAAGPATAPRRERRPKVAKPLDGAPVASGGLSLSVTPPSVNGMYYNRPKGGGRGKTLAYRNWRRDALIELATQDRWHVPGKVEVRIYLPAITRGDADNRIKATLDALVAAGRIEDDKHVSRVSAEFAPIENTVIMIQALDVRVVA